ncbi:MAG: hypothetical protein GTO51_03130 [Candidatus Latescibacteria bacterium]|nr:hypothetical protein [Candidatus Latescibacterota bacterium]NIM22678.1 hypothetical protein [Candidatus Latescibacterota bacterium]NIM64967.1 hypothetical protein [Candidatus Latescibacterota bacterium]NIO01482.1 hypothetical protein [Candidatus Latescibacterota bacterium]NIO27992.1 hypothetical protein [Candidatus Latescibacterota bacterium]
MRVNFRKIGIFFAIVVVVLVGGMIGLIAFTNRPTFCRSCHYMEPYYDAWATSTHKEVPCDLCHYTPGYQNMITGKFRDLNQLVKYVTNAYRRSKPWAEIEDASCLRSNCHDTRLLEGQVLFGDVKFNHRPHLTKMRRGKILRCTSCHSQIVQGEHITVTSTTCVLCHFKEAEKAGRSTDDCQLCHDAPTKAVSIAERGYDHTRVLEDELDCRRCHGEMIVGDGAVPHEQCYICHWDKERLDKYNDTELVHRMHISENKIECSFCHMSMEHKWTTAENVASRCDGCHQGMHLNQLNLFRGVSGLGIEDHPNPMYGLSLSCQTCHILHEAERMTGEGTTLKANGESCEPCHGKGYNRLLRSWNQTVLQKIDVLDEQVKDIERSYRATSARQKRETASELIKRAKANLDIVRFGKPVHNIVYANELLYSAYDDLREAGKTLGRFVTESELFTQKAMIPSDCRNCHVTINSVSVEVEGNLFQHGRHVEVGRSCSNCHTHQRRHGQTLAAGRDCSSCHHQNKDCSQCHGFIHAAYYGGKYNAFDFDPDMMAEAEIACKDCHEGEEAKVIRPTMSVCTDCHDDEYEAMGAEWQLEIASLVSAVDTVMTRLMKENMSDKAQEALRRDLQSFKQIKNDKSKGIHNHEGYQEILEDLLKSYSEPDKES